ncbi:hypothetical protein COCOBI_07-5910 [Coccomyxa sp. Obi]|nr:hypothetical protein COCOBI_07-5910 [Coccomyxa sp. Obi]
MGVFSCFSRAKTVDAIDGGDIMYSMDGMELKEGMSPGGSPGKNRRAAGSESLNGSPRKRIDYDALVKAKHMPGTNLHAVATANGAGSAQGNVELANARALVRALARKPESRRHLSKLLVLDGRDKLEMWWVEEGYLTDLTSVLLALEESKTRDRLYIPSRYQLFTLNQVRQGVKASEEAAAQALAAAQAAESGSNAVETTSKAALAALRCSQAANAAAAAEGNAMGSANHARIEQSMASLAAAMAAMALFEQAKESAHNAALAAHKAANATWMALERVSALYTSTRQYYMLDDLIEASAAAKRAIALTKEANLGWAAGSMQGRQTALAACKSAADAADTCHKELVNMFKLNT